MVYEKLNNYFNNFFLKFSTPLYENHLQDFLEMSFRTQHMLEGKDLSFQNKELPFLSLNESLSLCDEFIATYMMEYYDLWKKSLRDGTVDFSDILENEVEKGSWAGAFTSHHQVFQNVDVELSFDYRDPGCIIHEFCHRLNSCMSDYSSDNHIYDTFSRKLFTESVSIYFETLMYRFMEEKGYSKEEMAKCEMMRIMDVWHLLPEALDTLILARDFQIFGSVSDQNYEEAKRFHLPTFSSQNTYHEVASSFEKRADDSYDFIRTFSYVLGTDFAYYAISSDDANMPGKMLMFSQDLAGDRDLEYSLSKFSTNRVSIRDIVKGASQEVDRILSLKEKEKMR